MQPRGVRARIGAEASTLEVMASYRHATANTIERCYLWIGVLRRPGGLDGTPPEEAIRELEAELHLLKSQLQKLEVLLPPRRSTGA